jgi:uncharacterized integral membrane protein
VPDEPKLTLEDTASRALNTVMFGLLGAGLAVLIVFVLVVRIRAATSPLNFLQNSWQYALGAVVLGAWGVVAMRGGMRSLRRR